MKAYFDSSVLVAVYVTEERSAAARREVRRHTSIPWTPLHDLEVRSALRLLHGRGQIRAEELAGLLAHLDEDLTEGRLTRSATDLEAIFRRAETLSGRHAAETLARTLDVLHVAALVELGCTTLVSADERQLALAEREGLETVALR